MVALVGGYDSIGFWTLVSASLLVGSILNTLPNSIAKVIGLGLFLFGGALLTGLISYTIEKAPNLPSYATAFPLLFSVITLLVVFKMFQLPTIQTKHSKQNNKE